jgi:RNA polymerase sigma-70 factor
LIDNSTRLVTSSPDGEFLESLAACATELDAIYADCAATHPDFDLSAADFREGVSRAINKYLVGPAKENAAPSTHDVRRFIGELQVHDLYLALACARGNEPAWWEFDRKHRSFIESWARHLARGGTDADEAIDAVYVELFGTKSVGGVRQSKFRTYTGRGTLRGWLRTVILHAVVDLYRGRQSEISLDDWSASGDETRERPAGLVAMQGTEELMMTSVVRERYRSATMAALDQSLAALDEHETLLLLYYHVEGLKLREIARIVEEPRSPIRRWFQRQSKRRSDPTSRVHESTVMRWLERVYLKVSNRFHTELADKHGLNAAEIEICKTIVTEDPAQGVRLNPRAGDSESLNTKESERRLIEGAS